MCASHIGPWEAEETKTEGMLVIEPFGNLTKKDRSPLKIFARSLPPGAHVHNGAHVQIPYILETDEESAMRKLSYLS
jgi:hypothetical protein